jgi:hypothetical protein
MKAMRRSVATLGLAVAGVMVHWQPASAACAAPGFMKPTGWESWSDMASGPYLRSAVFRPNEDLGGFVRTDFEEGNRHGAEIVGMWRFVMTVPGPNGSQVVIDDGYSQWHSDGTEIMNSGAHAPNTSNFCLGVWEQTGATTYKLNHFPLAWDAAGTAPAGPVHIVATVTMKDPDHFSGPFTLDVYNWDGSEITNAEGAAVAHVVGTLSATRVTVDTKVPGT